MIDWVGRTAIHCTNELHEVREWSLNVNVSRDTMQHTATNCNTLQQTATHCTNEVDQVQEWSLNIISSRHTLQRTATHCNALQHRLMKWKSGVMSLQDGV